MEKILHKAKVTGRPVMIMYLSKKGLVSKRLVSVEKLSEAAVEGFCHLRKGKRRFLLENILAVLPAENHEIKTYMSMCKKMWLQSP